MIVEAAKLDVTQYTVHYELLRSQVIGPSAHTAQGDTPTDQRRGVGLALLLSEGMPGWLKTVETVLRAALAPREDEPASHQRSPQSSAAHVWLPSVQLHEVTTLLASLVLSTRPVAH
jgi:hypothetical protein